MKAGDLVEFYSSFEPFMREYEARNPGIILSVDTGTNTQYKVGILWANKEETTENSTYLRPARY